MPSFWISAFGLLFGGMFVAIMFLLFLLVIIILVAKVLEALGLISIQSLIPVKVKEPQSDDFVYRERR